MTKNINQTLLLLFIIFYSLKGEAKKMNFPLEVVAGNADLIVIGEVDAVKKNEYTFIISETLKGVHYKSIVVEIFEEWICDTRVFKLEKGQKLCLFLKKGSNNWTVINGGTGELEILNDLIYLGGDDFFKPIDTEIYRKKFLENASFHYPIARNDISLAQFKNAIKDFCKCYQFIGEFGYINNKPQFFIQNCSDLQISNFKVRSKFSEWLFEKMEGYPIQKIVSIDYGSVFKPFPLFWLNNF